MAIDDSKKTIWQRKEIAPLDWCSLDRAVRLLGCEIEDLLHWHNTERIRLSLDCVVSGDLRIFMPADDLFYDINDNVKYEISKYLDRDRYEYSIDVDDNYQFQIDPYGIWSVPIILDGVIEMDGFIDYTAGIIVKKDLRPYQETKRGVAFFMGTRGEIKLNQKKLLITKENIEKIYRAIDTGVFEREETIQESIKAANTGGTAKQADFIVGLIKGLGLNDDDLKQSIGFIKNKITAKSKYKHIPFPSDDKTLTKWLRNGGVDR